MQHSKLESRLPETLKDATEGEKADWLFEDDEEALLRFEQARDGGTLQVLHGDHEAVAKAATIYLPSDDMELAAQHANSLGVDTATYLETVIRTALHHKTAA